MLAAVVLLAVAGVTVAGAAFSGSWLLLTTAAAVSVLLGAAATRITYAELIDSRRDAARDRAELARDYRDLSGVRVAEHQRYVVAVEHQINSQQARIAKIEGALEAARGEAGVAQRRLVEVTSRAERAETRGAELASHLEQAEEARTEAVVRVIELEHEVDVLTAQWQSREAQRKHA